MFKWLTNLFNRQLGDERADRNHPTLALEREVQTLRLDLDEKDRAIARLQADLDRQRDGADAQVEQVAQARMERLFADVAAPVAQLLTQAHLVEVEGRPVQARDILSVARRLVRALEDQGLTLEESVGESAPFDPARHEPLSAHNDLQPGQPALVRFVGVAYRGRRLRKAGVERAEG